MRKCFTSALILFVLVTVSLAVVQPIYADSQGIALQWSMTYPRPPSTLQNLNATHFDDGSCFVQTSDGGYAIVGNTEDDVIYSQYAGGGYTTNDSAIMIKTDTSGNLQWQKVNPAFSDALAVFQTKDSGYFLVTEQGYLLKLDAQGNIQSNRSLGMSISGAVEAKDGDFILVGLSDWNDAFIAKTDQTGDLLWNKTLYSFPNDQSNDYILSNVAIAQDGGYLIACLRNEFSNSIGKGFINLWLLKTDSNGDLEFSKTYSYNAYAGQTLPPGLISGNPAVISSVFVAATRDGGCLLAGEAGGPYFAKLDSHGNWQWNRLYTNGSLVGGDLSSAVETPSGAYVAVGGFPFSGINQALMIQTAADGNLQATQLFPSSVSVNTGGSSIIAAKDGGYTVLGSLDGNVWLAKFAASSTPSTQTSTVFDLTATLIVAVLIFIVCVSVVFLLFYRKRHLKENKSH
jgi:hypothetical protein